MGKVIVIYEVAKYEFSRWLDSLRHEMLTPYDITLLNIIVENFDEIASKGVNKGGRAKLLGRLIESLENKVEECSVPSITSNGEKTKVVKLTDLYIEDFRGFGHAEKFNFEKQYTFYHGPNGSGKTSFCEALEYSVLGNISEASARNIPVKKYIIHAGKRKAKEPILNCMLEDGTITIFPTDYAKYRFSFVEKNRILDFSHIGAATSKSQTERIAALFGLSEFQAFVSDFTEEFDNRYITLETDISDIIDAKQKEIKSNEAQLQKNDEKLALLELKLKDAISVLGKKEIETADKAIEILTDAETGLLTLANRVSAEKYVEPITLDIFDELLTNIKKLQTYVQTIKKYNRELLSNVKAVNLANLYKAVEKVSSSYKENVCPVCRTPLDRTVENPFIFSTQELEKLEKIEKAKNAVKDATTDILEILVCISNEISTKSFTQVFPYNKKYKDIKTRAYNQDEVNALTTDFCSYVQLLEELGNVLEDKKQITKFVNDFNNDAIVQNTKYQKEAQRLQSVYEAIVSANADVSTAKSNIAELKKKVEEDKAILLQLKKDAKTIKQKIDFNKKMVKAYNVFRKRLMEYTASLPVELAKNLSEKACEYYNYINYGDAEFEQIKKLDLPLVANEKINVTMCDNMTQDALQILSEGHVKILGLSILLAKSVVEKVPFIIFDDIVNAIDDDHRTGVASLLTTHDDFNSIQMILTCHGELFVTTLESLVNKRDKVERYMFLPADTLNERGAVIKYQDSTIPLYEARKNYEDNKLKASAAKCRQAVECIAGRLWAQITKINQDGISVPLRSLKNGPDLYNVISGLIGATKPGKINGCDDLHDDLGKLQKMRIWNLLNKGTHEQENLPEFSRQEVLELLNLIEKINEEVNKLRLKASALQ